MRPKVKTWNPGGKTPEDFTSPLNVKDMRHVRRLRRQSPLINLLVLHYSRFTNKAGILILTSDIV